MTPSWTFWLLASCFGFIQAAIYPRAVCTPVAGGSSAIDDVPAITSAIASCGNGGTIVIPEGTTYHLNSALSFTGCKNCDFQLEGLLKFSSDTAYWKGRTAMIDIPKINGLRLRSLTGNGVIDGNGQNAYANYHPAPLRLLCQEQHSI
jgi:galacturan 1,4-alpha-galacturonidase